MYLQTKCVLSAPLSFKTSLFMKVNFIWIIYKDYTDFWFAVRQPYSYYQNSDLHLMQYIQTCDSKVPQSHQDVWFPPESEARTAVIVTPLKQDYVTLCN